MCPCSVSAEITCHKVLNERFIFVASSNCSPVAPVLAILYDPARSTILSFPALMCCFRSFPISDDSTVIVKIACERLDRLFILVYLVTLFLRPKYID